MKDVHAEVWSRPALQRRELGPVLHDIAHKVSDGVESDITDEAVCLEPVKDVNDLAENLGVLHNNLHDRTKPHVGAFIRLLTLTVVRAQSAGEILTIPAPAALHEGVASGVLTPFKLLQSIVSYEEYTGTDPFDTSHFQGVFRDDWHQASSLQLVRSVNVSTLYSWADRIVTPNFQTMLHQMAYGYNGSLGSQSSQPYELHKPLRSLEDPEGAFIYKDGTVTGFSVEFLARQRIELRDDESSQLKSGGCPVRHSTFKRIGEAAALYLDSETEDGRPIKEGQSAITRGSHLLSFALRQMAEVTEAAPREEI